MNIAFNCNNCGQSFSRARSAVFKTIILLGVFLLTAVFDARAADKQVGDDYSRWSIVQLTAKAEQGDASAQFWLGRRYVGGEGVTRDYTKAVKWFRKAAEQGHGDAQFWLGTIYVNGEGVPKDAVEAVKWFRKVAEQNYAPAQFQLGVCYANGQGVPSDAVEAVKWFRKAAEQDYTDAQFKLGVCYVNGQGVPSDAVEAVKWFRKAAEQGHIQAKASLIACEQHRKGVVTGEDFTTLNRQTYKNATVVRTEPDGITIRHESGVIKIPFSNLPNDVQQRFGYDPLQAQVFARTQRAAVAENRRQMQARAEALNSTPPRERTENAVVQTFSGTGIKNTRPFTVNDGWEIQWDAQGEAFALFLHRANGEIESLPVFQQKSGKGASYQAKGGEYYLQVNGVGDWTIKIVQIKER